MSLLRRYNVKYESESLNIKNNIMKIYNYVNKSFPDDEMQYLVLTGSSALFMYIYALGYNDLFDKLEEPSDVDLLIVLNSRKIKIKPHFNIFYIGDYQRINKKSKEPIESDKSLLESSVTFKNKWTSDNINEFDLTYVFSSGIHHNLVSSFNLIKLEELLLFYQADLSLPERAGKDKIKIEIIQEIIKRLQTSPRPDLIHNVPKFSEINLSNLAKLSSVARTLFN
jgi:hypothetical protein